MPEERKDVVNAHSVAYDRMAARWELIQALLGGTPRMQEDGERWLPREQEESQAAYKARLNRSVLYEAYGDTVEKIVATPFQEPITLGNELPGALAYLEDDVDKTGQSITELGRSLLEDLCNFGKAHILVDFTSLPQNAAAREGEGAPVASIAEEKAAGARATFVRVPPPDLIGWQTEDDANGNPILTQVRIQETKTLAKGEFLDEEVEFVRVYGRDTWSLWRKDDEGEFRQDGPGGFNTLGEVPLITIYATRDGFMVAYPPLEKLAWLNLAHYQSDSDQRNILRIGRFGILFAKGLTKEEAKKGLTIGPFQMYVSSSDQADLKYVEHAGKAMEAGRFDLQDLVDRMEVMGHQPLVKKANEGTATGKRIDAAKNLSILQSWIQALEAGLRGCFELAARWHKLTLPEVFRVDIFSDFTVALAGSEDEEFLLKLSVAGKLSTETLLNEIKRRGTLADAVDVDEELERIETDGPPGMDPDPNEPNPFDPGEPDDDPDDPGDNPFE